MSYTEGAEEGCFRVREENQNGAEVARGARRGAQLQAAAKGEFLVEDPLAQVLGYRP